MSLKIHAFPLSPRGFKVLAVANHLSLDYEFCICDLTKGDQKNPGLHGAQSERPHAGTRR